MARTLCQGMTGQDVRALQDALNYQIRRGTPLKVDGIFGPKTLERVREFQRANQLVVDGIAGPKTQGWLYEEGVPGFKAAEHGHSDRAARDRLPMGARAAVRPVRSQGIWREGQWQVYRAGQSGGGRQAQRRLRRLGRRQILSRFHLEAGQGAPAGAGTGFGVLGPAGSLMSNRGMRSKQI